LRLADVDGERVVARILLNQVKLFAPNFHVLHRLNQSEHAIQGPDEKAHDEMLEALKKR